VVGGLDSAKSATSEVSLADRVISLTVSVQEKKEKLVGNHGTSNSN